MPKAVYQVGNFYSMAINKMIKYLLVLLVVLCLTVAKLSPEESVQICSDLSTAFDQYKKAFNKVYTDPLEQADAMQNVLERCGDLMQAGSFDGRSYKMGLSGVSDRSKQQMTTKLKFKEGGFTDKDVQKKSSSEGAIVGAAKRLVGNSCPSNYRSISTTPKDQGSCGSCWAFATTAAYETNYNRVNNVVLDLAEEYVLECLQAYTGGFGGQLYAPASTCAGGILDHALEMLLATGQPDESSLPYAGSNFGTVASTPNTISSCSPTSNFYQLKFPSNDSMGLTYRYNNLTSASMQSLLQQGSLVVAFYVENGFYSYSSGIYSCPVNSTDAYTNINHAVELVGMDCNGNYIIKNSWGTSWGDGGYATIDPLNDCGLSAYVYSMLYSPYVHLPVLALLAILALIL